MGGRAGGWGWQISGNLWSAQNLKLQHSRGRGMLGQRCASQAPAILPACLCPPAAGAGAAVCVLLCGAAGGPAEAPPAHHLLSAAPGASRCCRPGWLAVAWRTSRHRQHAAVAAAREAAANQWAMGNPACCPVQVWQVISQRRQQGAGGLARLHSALISTGVLPLLACTAALGASLINLFISVIAGMPSRPSRPSGCHLCLTPAAPTVARPTTN